MLCYFYILWSERRSKYYIGHTCDDLPERLRRHNSDHKGFTGGVGDWTIVYTEEYLEKARAYKREREVKEWKSRRRIERLIGSAGSEHPGR
ncbi:MAG: GIY-YIG nuclease family protein [Imperialibacter sp.]|uniref:GIY-YIG nuclease family protein n=1 Tax=Imperialibacter sp. TaxID=2038411 RepID=UPI0032EB4953